MPRAKKKTTTTKTKKAVQAVEAVEEVVETVEAVETTTAQSKSVVHQHVTRYLQNLMNLFPLSILKFPQFVRETQKTKVSNSYVPLTKELRQLRTMLVVL